MDAAGGVRARAGQALAALWSLDALLKLQPHMFTPALFVNVLGPVAVDDQPPWFASMLDAVDRVWVRHMALADLAVFAVEASIALLLWWGPARRPGRIGLWLLLAWLAVVWVFGEGMGGLVSGDASILSEAPGTTVFYAATAVALLAPLQAWQGGRVAQGLRWGLGLFWLMGAALQLNGSFWTAAGLGGIFGNVTMNGLEPVFVLRLLDLVLGLVMAHPAVWNLVIVAALAALGVATLALGPRPAVAWAATVWLLLCWATAQAFGGLFTGTATDPGAAVAFGLFVWLARAAWGARPTSPARDAAPPAVSA